MMIVEKELTTPFGMALNYVSIMLLRWKFGDLRSKHTGEDEQSLGIQEPQLDLLGVEGGIFDSSIVCCHSLDGDEAFAVGEKFGF